jgi:hypothetical protein
MHGGMSIFGEGWQQCSGSGWGPTRLRVRIQQYRGLGYWATKREVTTDWRWLSYRYINTHWHCAAGSGLQTYRVVTTGWAVGGYYSASVQSGNYLRVYCP